ncbi:hypothetical protein Q4489_07495 [Thalassotalea sp. 1_MG-2023]|uniref:hypothetical protein n=1 Tax=Thalassotalea sp. 1_MG-2023 TaxID=3062680 RepID=UPI0026E1368D|nr:hypothetical protein [Thalassotalea sp. 1_MG-2023]MDO6426850.1 hypothetical protein [Thalassotalea sp. 1_MG-2023]
MTWIYKSFTYAPKPKGFAKVDNLFRGDSKFEKILNNYSELGWEYVEAISLNIGILSTKEYLILLRGKHVSAYNTLEQKVLNEAKTQVKI